LGILDPMKRITGYDIRIIPHEQHRYETCGDWWYEGPEDNAVLHIRVSQMPEQTHEQMVLIHELAEVILCNQQGVTQQDVDNFDTNFESNREVGLVSEEAEPGDSPNAPYKTQHCFATAIERLMCAALGITWQAYEEEINKLFEK